MSLKEDLIDKQARFWVLLAGGATSTAASVPVKGDTASRWVVVRERVKTEEREFLAHRDRSWAS